MLQIPNLPNYMVQQQTSYVPMPQQPNYNAVKIDIHNPSVGGATCPIQQPQYNPQYAPVTAPYYSYPQAQLYNYPQAEVQQPAYLPQQIAYLPQQPVYAPTANATANAAVNVAPQQAAPAVCPPCPVCEPAPAVPVPQVTAAAAASAAASVVPQQPVQQPQQVNINQAPAAPAPAVTEAPAVQPAVEIVQPAPMAPQVDLNGFIARLASPDYEIQANTMEEIANMVKDEPQKATELLDAKIIDELVKIVNTDSSKLAGPTQEQISARQKLMSGQQISDADKALAITITPMEQAERNKSYAMFTSAILQKLYGDEVAKLTGTTVPLTELPAAMTIVDQLKDNPNPMVRSSAIEALSYIQRPEYKNDLNTLFTIAKNDQDKNVQEAATAALEKLNQV